MLYVSDHRFILVFKILAYHHSLYYNCIFSKYIPIAVLLQIYIFMNIIYIISQRISKIIILKFQR